MSYTEFRKSYGDFEVVIPPVDFSSLTKDKASHTVNAMRSYESDFVCLTLQQERAFRAALLITDMIYQASEGLCNSIGPLIEQQLNSHDDETIPFFSSISSPGIILRKAWCEHMANEIEREFGLTLW